MAQQQKLMLVVNRGLDEFRVRVVAIQPGKARALRRPKLAFPQYLEKGMYPHLDGDQCQEFEYFLQNIATHYVKFGYNEGEDCYAYGAKHAFGGEIARAYVLEDEYFKKFILTFEPKMQEQIMYSVIGVLEYMYCSGFLAAKKDLTALQGHKARVINVVIAPNYVN